LTENYKYGRDKEQKVANALRNKGASGRVSRGSKSAVDLKVVFPSGTKWNIQVKSSRSKRAAPPTSKEVGRLKQGAIKSSATPVIAKVTPEGIEYESASTGRTLVPPKRRK